MGRTIAKQIRGMNGWAKGSLILALTLLVTTFMYQGWFSPNNIDSATNTYRFYIDSAPVNVGVDGSTITTATAGQTAGGKYSLSVSTYTNTTPYISVPANATTTICTMYGPLYVADTALTAPVLRLAQRAGAVAGQTTSAVLYDYDPVSGSNTPIWTATGAAYTSTSTGYISLTFASATAYTISHGHRVKIAVSATNAAATAGRLYFYSSATNSSYFTVSENFPASTTDVTNLVDYNNGNITGVIQGQQNIAMLSFQMSTNSTSNTSWTGGFLDKIGSNVNLEDATFAIYRDTNNDGSFNPLVDQKISDETSFTQAAGQAYSLVVPQTVSTTAQRYFVVFNLSPAAANGTTVGAQILDETYFTVGAKNMNPMISGASSQIAILATSTAVTKTYQADFNSGTTLSTPLSGSTNSTCSAANSTVATSLVGLLNYPSHSCTAPAATNYLGSSVANASFLTLYFNGAGYASDMTTVAPQSITFFAGSSSGTQTVTVTMFYVKPDGSRVNSATSSQLATITGTTATTRTISLTTQSFSSVPRGSKLGVQIGVTANTRLAFNSAAGAKLVVQETAAANNGVDIGDGKVITDATVTAPSTGKVVDAFTMIAGTSQTVSSITISGANTNATNIASVKIYSDRPDGANNYGTLGTEDTLIGSGVFNGTSAVVAVSESVGTSLQRYLVVYDMAATAVVGQKITGLVTAVGGATADVNADTSSAGLTVLASTVVTEGTGEPATVSVAPGGSAANLDSFGLYTNGPSDTINTVTVQLSGGTAGAVALMEIIDRTSGTVYGSSTAPISSDTWRMTVTGLSATSATTQCYVRITPKGSIAGTYAVTGQVTAISHVQTSNVLYYNDAASAIVVIDGNAPPDPTLIAKTGASPGQINLNWNAVTDSNVYNAGITYKLVRGPENAPAPADCSSGYQVYQGPLTSIVDDTAKSDGHNYTFSYRVCAIDGVGNRGNGSIASAAAKLPQICNQAPTITFTTSPNQYAKTGGSVDYSLNIINNDIGDCPPVDFTVGLVGTPNLVSFEPPVLNPTNIRLSPNGGGADVAIHIKALDSAQQGDGESFTVQANGGSVKYLGTAKETLVATVNNFGPMLHSSFSVGTKYGSWGVRSTCNDCHMDIWENSNNIKLISENVLTPLGRRPVLFSKLSSSTATLGIFGNEQRSIKSSSTNVCEVCHHQTKFHQYSAVNQQTALNHHNGENCMVCHPHRGGFKYAGGAVDCISCHGNPPTSKVEMVQPPLNALGANPSDWGTHARHNNLQITCDACHNNYVRAQMGNRSLEMGFNITNATYPGFGGSVQNGTVTVSSTYNTYYNWTSRSDGTRVIKSDNQAVPSCNVYCHGGWQGGGGTNTSPTWVGNYQAACGTCHNYTNANPPTTGSHLKHAKDGNFLDNGVQVGGLNMACVKCHGAFGNFTGSKSSAHINGNVEWNLNGVAPGALYKGAVSGGTGSIAPSASFGACGNLYCHSNVQGANGVGAPTAFYTPTWGGTANCGSCHVNMYTDGAATGGHKQHSQPSANFATPFDCRICHGNGGSTNPQNHANGAINMDFSGYGSNTLYSRGVNVAPGTPFGDCSNSDCHGRRTVTWGASSSIPLCEKCHGSRTSEGGFYTTAGPGTTTANTDPVVGAHNAHIHQTNSVFTLYTSYSAMKDCDQCHIKPNGPYDAGHIDTALPAEVVFQPGAIANRAVFYGFTGAVAASYNAQARSCSNVWCHGAAMDSNVGRGAYANVVADGGTLGAPQTPTWNQPLLNGNPGNDCTRCHSYPPPGPTESYSHFSHYTSINGVDVALLKQPNECTNCHINVNAGGSGFINSASHINGNVDKGCNACHGVPPNTVAELAILSNGALAPGAAGAHKPHADLPAIGKNCTTCHNGYTTTMPSLTLEMGFNAFGGKVATGAFWGYSTVNNGLTTYVSSSPGTVVYQTNTTTEQNSCAVYCHGLKADGSAFIGGRFGSTAKPVWDSGASMVCGNCHGVNITYLNSTSIRPKSAPTSSSHPKHASPTSAMNLTCDVCHGVITNFTHVNGSVAWKLDTTNPKLGASATYGGTAAGATGAIAPSATYGSCNNVYCHSDGTSSTAPSYVNQAWGAGSLTCGACHKDMLSSGTGSHVGHVTDGYTCISCHGAGYAATGVTAATHVDRVVNVSTTYSKGATFTPGSTYGTCSNSCHGRGTPSWGTDLGSVQCRKCHADGASATFFNTDGITATSDPHVGFHTSHLQATHGIAVQITCDQCHSPVATINATSHMNGSVDFNSANITSFTSPNCTSSCHKGKSVAWNATGYFTGDKAHDCAMCHAIPAATAAHTQGIIDDYTARGFAACVSCHPHLNSDGSFNNVSLHMNGAVDAISSGGGNCSSCHATLAAMTGSTTTYHHVLGSTAPDYSGNTCLKCHADHDIFQTAQNAANTAGVAANLRVDNAIVPTRTAPDNGDGTGTFTNTDFVANATNGGICVSCHQAPQTKNLTNQLYVSPYVNTTTMVVTKSQYTLSMHNYTTSSTFTKDNSKFLANCSKCHSDTMAETKQAQPKTFGLHLSATRELFTTFGAANPTEAREDRLCFGCHSQRNDAVGGGQTIKPVDGKEWYGSRTMKGSAEDTFKSFSSATRVFRHNTGKYNKSHKANENETYLGANKHVECADCHNSHGAKAGNHTQGSATLANVLQGVPGVLPNYGSGGSTPVAGLPGLGTTTVFYFKNSSPGTPTSKKTTDTITSGTFQSMDMSATTGATATTQVISIPTATVASSNFMGTAFVSAPMSAGTLSAQSLTLNMAVTASASSSPNRARLKGYVYLWDGTTATQLSAPITNTGAYLPTTKATQSLAFTIPQTTVTANSRLVIEVYVITGTAATTSAMTATLSWGNATDTSNITLALAGSTAVWATADSFTPQSATQEYQICFKCHSNANPNLATWGGSGAAAWTDLALEFNPNNASRHPIGTPLAAGSQLTAARLTGGWTPGMVMNCSDCHATDSTASKGPHGSTVKWMLAGANKAWPYTAAAQNGGGTGTMFTLATYNSNAGTNNGLFCLNCHTVSPATGANGWHTNANVASSRHYQTQAIASCAACHIRVPHGGKISRLLQTTNAPVRYRSNGSSGTPSFTKWGSATVNIKGTSMNSSYFGSSCSEHSGTGGEAW